MALAFVFPGQGSQAVGMSSNLAEDYDVVKQTFDEASDALGYNLWQLVCNGPEDKLNKTQYTQPAMLSAGVAVWRVWQERGGPQPAVLAGHSLGEYTALVCADALDFSEGVRLVADRARFMQAAVPPGEGAMAAILGLDDEAVVSLCAQAAEGQVLSAVNFNSPGQVVIAGETSAVDRAVAQAGDAGAKRAVKLPVSVPSHCSLMHQAAEDMADRLKSVDISEPGIPVIHNVNVSSESDGQKIRSLLVQQIENPVRWVETVEKIADQGVTTIIECGPGRVLTGLNKRITKAAKTVAVFDSASLDSALEKLAG
jgi:[acyl-carrier-protein] S-malonyltransferase